MISAIFDDFQILYQLLLAFPRGFFLQKFRYLGKVSLTLLVAYHWATGWLQPYDLIWPGWRERIQTIRGLPTQGWNSRSSSLYLCLNQTRKNTTPFTNQGWSQNIFAWKKRVILHKNHYLSKNHYKIDKTVKKFTKSEKLLENNLYYQSTVTFVL